MGWGDCGTNSTTGEEMGYNWEGICHVPGCGKEINHGLYYVCGDMHEGGEHGCGYYFCEKHLNYHFCDVKYCRLCDKCLEEFKHQETESEFVLEDSGES